MKKSWLRKTPNTKRRLELKADALWRIAVFEKWGTKCEICQDHASTPHHYIPKSRNALLRLDVRNGVPLCFKHHYIVHFDKNPERVRETLEIIREKRGKEWRDYIDKVKNIHGQNFRSIKYLQDKIKSLQ